MKKILVLGGTGMLGHMVFHYLKNFTDHDVSQTTRDNKKESYFFDADDFLFNKKPYSFLNNFDYIINCIGIIKPYCKDNDPHGVHRAVKINALFPHELNQFCKKSKVNIIQIATDCVFSGNKGQYVESDIHDPLDVYGKTKSLGEVFEGTFLNIRCSIIGPELKSKLSILEWFLSQKPKTVLQGFEHHQWNGVTTLQFAKLCKAIIEQSMFDKLIQESHIHHFIPNTSVSKYELLHIFKNVFKKNVTIQKVSDIGEPIDRTLSSRYNLLNTLVTSQQMNDAVIELKEYMDTHL